MVCEVDDLKCTHEEPDTRMLLHAVYSGTTGSRAVAIVSEDIDVFIVYQFCIPRALSKLVQMLGAEQLTYSLTYVLITSIKIINNVIIIIIKIIKIALSV